MMHLIWIGLLCHFGFGLTASNVSLSITPSGPIVPRIGGVLNITCHITNNDERVGKYKLDWIVPESAYSRVNFTQHPNALTLVINNVQDGDTGVYFCNASNEDQDMPTLFANVTVLKVVPKKGTCSTGFFICQNGDCIIQRYVCDGRPDCPDKSDEIEAQCGPEPCKGKIPCGDRCIPNSLCCYPPYDGLCPNHQPDCCRDYFLNSKEGPHQGLLDDQHHGSLEDRHRRYESDMGFLQSTIYTIIGCAVAFIFIVTIMVVAVCRVHMKQAAMSAHPRTLVTRSSLYWTHRSSQDLTSYIRESGTGHVQHLSYPPSTNLLVTYNINNGVQLVGHLVEPPPYSEIAEDTPVVDGPPPPYSSAEDLQPMDVPSGLTPDANSSRTSTEPGGFPNQALLRPNVLVNRRREDD